MNKVRILYVLKVLSEETDKDTSITLHQLSDKLCSQTIDGNWGDQRIRADLKLIEYLCDISALPFCLQKKIGAHGEYRYSLYRKKFGLNEARLVFDSVSTSCFLSDEQKREILHQMEGFLSRREVTQLQERVHSRSSQMIDKEFPYKLQTLYSAINMHRCLKCNYYRYDVNGEKKLYTSYSGLRPIEVIWGDGHYYLLAVNPKRTDREPHRYRVDRMENIEEDNGTWFAVEQNKFSYGQFEMFGSNERKTVILRVHKSLIDMTREVLSPNALFRADDDPEWSRVSDEVEISEGFLRWVLRQAGKMEVIAPEDERNKIKEKLKEMLKNYS